MWVSIISWKEEWIYRIKRKTLKWNSTNFSKTLSLSCSQKRYNMNADKEMKTKALSDFLTSHGSECGNWNSNPLTNAQSLSGGPGSYKMKKDPHGHQWSLECSSPTPCPHFVFQKSNSMALSDAPNPVLTICLASS